MPAQKAGTRTRLLVNLLRLQGVEVGVTNAEVKLKDGAFPAGSFIIKRDQPYGRLAKILLEKQNFPDQNLRTYDDTGWTMGLMLNVEVKEIADRAILEIPVSPVTTLEPKSILRGAAKAAYAIVNDGSNDLITLRYRLKDLKVQAIEQAFKTDQFELPAGSFVIAVDQGNDVHGKVKSGAESLGL